MSGAEIFSPPDISSYVEVEIYTPSIPNATLRDRVSPAVFDLDTVKYERGGKRGVYVMIRNVSARFTEYEYDNERDVTVPVSGKKIREAFEREREAERKRESAPAVSQPKPRVPDLGV